MENLLFRETYLSEMQSKKNWYWEQEQHHQIVIVTTFTIVHPCLDSTTVKDILHIIYIFEIKTGTKITAKIPNMYH